MTTIDLYTKGQGPHDGYLREHPRNSNLRLDIKSADEGTRQISGIASTGDVDRMSDILDPAGASWTVPLPLLEAHDHQRIVGNVTHLKRTPQGIEFRARVARVNEPESLRQRLDEIWSLIRTKLLNSVSVGFAPTTWKPRSDGKGTLFTAFEILELSIVCVPANPRARIETVSEAASYRPSALDLEIDAVLARSRSPVSRSYHDRVVRLDGPVHKPAAGDGVVRLTPADWERAKR